MNTKEATQALLDGKKIRETSWIKGSYAYLVDGKLISERGNSAILCDCNIGEFFELYEEPKPKKRYWLWDTVLFIDGPVFKCSYYMDDTGINTHGEQMKDKSQLIRKHENEFIDV